MKGSLHSDELMRAAAGQAHGPAMMKTWLMSPPARREHLKIC